MKLHHHFLLGLLISLTALTTFGLTHLARASVPMPPAVNGPQPPNFQTSLVNFEAVDMVSSTDGWAIGGNLIYRYNGTTWQLFKALDNALLLDIQMVSATEGWAVGKRPGLASGADTGIWHFNGSDWQIFPSPSNVPLHAIDMLSPTDGWAVGGHGLTIHYNGTSWQQLSTTPDIALYSIDMVSSNNGWAGGGGSPLRYNGVAWSGTYYPGVDTSDISMVSTSDGWSVGYGGALAHYNGATWSPTASPTSEELRAVEMLSASNGWAAGTNGVIIRYNGSSWQKVTSPTTKSINDISMISSSDGWAVGNSGTLLHWNGSNWQRYNDSATQLLLNPSFESGSNPSPWKWNGPCNWSVYKQDYILSTPYQGDRYLATNRKDNSSCTSFYQDISRTPAVGEKYTFGIWVRSNYERITRQGEVVIWATGGTQEKSSKNFTINGNEYQYIETSLTVANGGHTGLRAEVYLKSPPDSVDYYFDNAALWGGARYSISGRIVHSNGKPVSGATISAGGRTVTTKGDGSYVFGGLTNGSYTLTPSKSGYTFSPSSLSVNVSNSNVTGRNFTGTTPCASLTTIASTGGYIVVTPSPDCPTDSSKYKSNTEIWLVAIPDSGYHFDSWSGYASGSYQVISMTLGSQNRTANANFSINPTPPPKKPVVVFVHGWNGPPLKDGWPDMNYEANNNCKDIAQEKTEVENIMSNIDPQPLKGKDNTDFGSIPDLLREKYIVYAATLVTDVCYTPRVALNAKFLRDQLRKITENEQVDKVILVAHSMGGIVSRYYIETDLYEDNVQSLFTFGSPHLGVNTIEILYAYGYLSPLGGEFVHKYLDRQIVSVDLSETFMRINTTFLKRNNSVTYYLVGGDAPFWSRSAMGLATGALLLGADDGFIKTNSSLGLKVANNVQHWQTDEVHQKDLGWNSYFLSNGSLLSKSYRECLNPILMNKKPSCEKVGQSSASIFTLEMPDLTENNPFQGGTLFTGQSVTHTISLEGGPALFITRWQTGTVSARLINPDGQIIDPVYAATYPDNVTYEIEGNAITYYFTNTIAGEWQSVIDANDVPAAGTAYLTTATFNSNLTLSAGTDRDWYTPGATAVLTASISGSPTSAVVTAIVRYEDGITETINLPEINTNQFQVNLAVPNKPGYAMVNLATTGSNVDEFSFERNADLLFQISPNSISLNGVYSDTIDSNLPHQVLTVTVGINSVMSGTVGLSADLVDGSGNFVAHAVTFKDVTTGLSTIELSFEGDDIQTSQRNGPYILTNLSLVDNREAMLIVAEAQNVYTTAAYNYRDFGNKNSVYLPIILKN